MAPSRISRSRQRQHDPADPRRRRRGRGRDRQAVLEPHPHVPAHPQGRARTSPSPQRATPPDAERRAHGAPAVPSYPPPAARRAADRSCRTPETHRRSPTPAARARLVPRPREPRLLLRRRGLPRALGRRPERLQGAAETKLFERFSDDGRLVAHRAASRARPACRGLLVKEQRRACSSTSGSRSSRIRTSGRSRCSRTPRCCSSTCILAALEEDMILKDSTPYNVQFKGAKPVFVDVGSFERLREGEPWVGYRQFCMLYLYPLLLQAVKDVAFHPLAARRDRRHHARPRCAAGLVPRPLPQGLLPQRLPARQARGAPRRPRQGGQGRGQEGRLQEGADRGQRAQDAQARRAPRAGTRPRASGSPTASATATPTTTPSARTSSSARSPPRSPGT